MMKVEAVVVRDRVETVMEAVEAATGHVGVTVIEAVGHGREKGITHEYRGRVFESRFLPKAHMTFVVARRDRGGRHRRDRRRGAHRPCDGRRDLLGVARRERHPQPHRSEARGGRGAMTLKEVGFAASTIWVIFAAILVIFMQAGFAFLEAGLTRMKNVGHIAAKNVLILGDRVDRLLLRRLRDGVRRRRQRPRRRLGLLPDGRRAAHDRAVAVLVVQRHPGRGRLPVRGRLRGRLARDRLGRDGRAHQAVGVLRLRRPLHAHLLASSRTGSGARTAGSSRGACRTSPARPSSTTRAPSRASRARSCSGRGSASSAPTASRTRSRATTWRSRRSA